MNNLPVTQTDKNNYLSEKLTLLNPILAKLESKVAYNLYKDFKSFADHVARSSGGFMRFGAISKEEKALIPLSMLTPVEYEEEE